MKAWSSAVAGIVVGALLGVALGIRRGAPVVAGGIAVTGSIATYGFLAYPQYRTRWSGSHSRFWYSVFGIVGPALMVLTSYSPLLPGDLSVVVLLGCLWIGGGYTGLALAHESATGNEPDASSTVRASPGD